MKLPDDKIDEVRRTADIVDIVSDYVRLQPAGRNFKALSPFTNEKTPSFIVSPDKQIYKCFSTGKGGNVFTFVMEMEKVGFIDAVKFIAKRVGIDLSAYDKASVATQKDSPEHDALTFAAKFFHAALTTPEGNACFEYFKQRGLHNDTISQFGLGYAYDDWDRLHTAAQNAGIAIETLKTLGLVSYSEKAGKYFDVFRGRAMFPIFSTAGKVVGFGGRLITSDTDAPKYINSPESPLYEKSKLLYAMNVAKDEIRRKGEAILVEGYMDVISLHQAGIKHSVASSGTALTPDQAKLIGRLTKNVIFIYDGDSAGIKAMMRGIDVLLEQGLSPSVVSLPDQHDPDSFVREVGGEAFQTFAKAHQRSFLDFKLDVLRASDALSTPEKTRDSIRDLVGALLKIPDELAREFYLKALADKLDVGLGILQNEVRRQQSQLKERVRKAPPTVAPPPAKAREETHGAAVVPLLRETVSVAERTFLKAFLESTYHGSAVIEFAHAHLDLLDIRHAWVRQSVDFVVQRYAAAAESNKDFDVSTEITFLENAELRNFISELLIEPPISERWQTESAMNYARRCLTAFLDACSKLMLRRYDESLAENIARLQSEVSEEKIAELMLERNTLLKQKSEAKRELDLLGKNLVV
ncbi:MAG: hypothetical protein HY22_07550 [[Candidatus Thermochlorobacteriaceae] bacterium GBChlB]|nr:MAG: hypothetical protein HY22_07550 [[Candidatus Thermochlorobacteriaceae] bacterium GBChlB]